MKKPRDIRIKYNGQSIKFDASLVSARECERLGSWFMRVHSWKQPGKSKAKVRK